jgi:hypothetical protein
MPVIGYRVHPNLGCFPHLPSFNHICKDYFQIRLLSEVSNGCEFFGLVWFGLVWILVVLGF